MAVETPTKGGGDDRERRDFRKVTGMDPAANWLLEVARDDYLPEPEITPVPFLLELDDDAAVDAFNRLRALRGGGGGNGALVLGFGKTNGRARTGEVLPVLASLEWFRRLLDEDDDASAFRTARKRMVLSSPPDPFEQLPPGFPDFPEQFELPLDVDAPPPPFPPGTVVMAVIDDGLAFAHERFRRPSGTRVLTYWDMHRLIKQPNDTVELTYEQIDELLSEAAGAGGHVDEDQVYASAGQLDFQRARHKPLAWRLSHGTHVLDLAAGADFDKAVADRPIIAAQLPSPVVARTSGDLLDFYVCLGVKYAIERAAVLAPDAPLVINVSFGYLAEAHDGRGELDRFFDQVTNDPERKTRIVLPAGNSQLSRCHATIDFAAGAAVEFDWIVQPDDRTHSVIEVWLPPAQTNGNRMRVTVTRPDGASHSIDETPLAAETMFDGAKPIGLMELVERDLDGRRMFRIAIRPTARPQPHPGPIASAGVWRLRFAPGADAMHGEAHAWVQRDDSLYGYPQRGRQSYLEHPAYQRFGAFGEELGDDPIGGAPCPVTRASMLNAIASGAEVIVAGGYQVRDGAIAPYSSGGPNTPAEPPPWRKPDVLTPSDDSRVHRGLLAAGARSGARLALDGTSVASPVLARHVAAMLSAGSNGKRADVDNAAKASPIGGPSARAERSGFGRLGRLDALSVDRLIGGD